MALDGTPLLALVAGVTALAILGVAAWLPRTRRSVVGFLERVGALLGVSVLVLLTAGVIANNAFHFFASWDDLLGTATTTDQSAQGGTSAGAALKATVAGPGVTAAPDASLPALPSPGQRVQTFTVTGAASGLTGTVLVSLPVGYEDPANANRSYPVLEAFHGYPGSPTVWMDGVNLVPSLDAAAANGSMAGVIVVAPQIQFPAGADTECVDGGPGQPQVDTFVGKDVPAYLASHLRVSANRDAWATVGFSSGGYCAALTTMLHPQVFGAGLILGGYFTPDFGKAYRPFGPTDPAWKRYDLVTLAKADPPPVALWVETSQADSLSYTTSSAVLSGAKAPMSVESHVEVGAGHRMSVWQDAMPAALTWLAKTVPGFAGS